MSLIVYLPSFSYKSLNSLPAAFCCWTPPPQFWNTESSLLWAVSAVFSNQLKRTLLHHLFLQMMTAVLFTSKFFYRVVLDTMVLRTIQRWDLPLSYSESSDKFDFFLWEKNKYIDLKSLRMLFHGAEPYLVKSVYKAFKRSFQRPYNGDYLAPYLLIYKMFIRSRKVTFIFQSMQCCLEESVFSRLSAQAYHFKFTNWMLLQCTLLFLNTCFS